MQGVFAAGKPLYGIEASKLAEKRPTVVLTQGLCDVCAPTEAQAAAACAEAHGQGEGAPGGDRTLSGHNGATVRGPDDCACCCEPFVPGVTMMRPSHARPSTLLRAVSRTLRDQRQGCREGGDRGRWHAGAQGTPAILSISPQSLLELADSFVTVGHACGVPERGDFLRRQFLQDLIAVCEAVRPAAGSDAKLPTAFVLEWCDPPFDAGHWVPEVIQARPPIVCSRAVPFCISGVIHRLQIATRCTCVLLRVLLRSEC